MTDDTTLEQTLSRIVDLARTTLEAQTSLAKQSIELGRATVTSEIDPVTAGRTWLEAVSRESSRYWSRAGALGLDLAGELVALGTRGMSRVMTETQQAAHRSGTADTEAEHHTEPRRGGRADTGGDAPVPKPRKSTARRRTTSNRADS